jgi:nucleotide-binding universal stress UspA family protein
MELKSILCPIDFSEFSATAYQHALSLAEYYKARLVALHVVEISKYPFADYASQEADYGKFSKMMSEGGEMQLHRFTQQYSAGRLQPELVVDQGNAPRCILSFAQKENIEGIVMGTHGRSGFDRLVLGSSTDRVIRKAACPVLVVSNAAQKALDVEPDRRHRLSRILYCTDFSHNSEQARGYAISLAAEYKAELALFHVTEKPPDISKAEAIVAARTQELDKLVSQTERENLNVRSAVRFGKPYEEIVR